MDKTVLVGPEACAKEVKGITVMGNGEAQTIQG